MQTHSGSEIGDNRLTLPVNIHLQFCYVYFIHHFRETHHGGCLRFASLGKPNPPY